MADSALFKDPDLEPQSDAQWVALRNLVIVANLRAQLGADDPLYRPPERLDQLLTAYKKNIPAAVVRAGVERAALTLRALLEEGVTAEKLDKACYRAWLRDLGAQLTASTAAYTGSFFLFNALLARFIRAEADTGTQTAVPPLVHTASSLAVHRFLRTAEMTPGWTRAIDLDAKGAPAAAVTTKAGFRKTVAQYWPFFGSLLGASLMTPDPVDAPAGAARLDRTASRVEFRRDWGFAASAAVGLHRILAFERDHVWLDASTPMQRQAMLGAIDELTGVLNTAAALGKYAVLRPVAGLAGLAGKDLHPAMYEAWEWITGVSGDSKTAHRWPDGGGISRLFERTGLSIRRASMLFLPMGMFNTARGFTSSAPDYSAAINVGNDALLIAAWGYAMANSERAMLRDDNLAAEGKWRATRHLVSLARRAGPPPPADVAPLPPELAGTPVGAPADPAATGGR